MSAWGNLDNLAAIGTVTVVSGSATVTGSGTAFTTNVEAGDSVTIASNKYRVTNVGNATSLTIDPVSATSTAGATAFVQQGPKYISNVTTQNTYSIQNIFGVSADEVSVPENKARGFNSPGWAHYVTYSTTQGATRHKTETLVAMSKNFNENAAGSLQTDANDDTVLADYLLLFTTQPVPTSNTAGNSAVLSTVTASSPVGASITHQWFKKDNATATVYTEAGGVGITGNTTNTLTITNVANVNGNVFRLTISATGTGADNNTSAEVAVTSV